MLLRRPSSYSSPPSQHSPYSLPSSLDAHPSRPTRHRHTRPAAPATLTPALLAPQVYLNRAELTELIGAEKVGAL